RLAAASLLHRHKSEQAIGLLQRLAKDREPSVAAIAVARLVEIDTKLVLPVLDDVLASQGASVRDFGVQVLFRHPTEKHRSLLADRFDDPHPDVRIKAREFLVKLAEKQEFRNQNIAEGMRVLESEGWRGQEQATLLLTQLNHKPGVGQFVKRLKADRPEVLV